MIIVVAIIIISLVIVVPVITLLLVIVVPVVTLLHVVVVSWVLTHLVSSILVSSVVLISSGIGWHAG